MKNVSPEIEYVGIYFARHGYLWIVPVSEWTAHKEFARTENAFFEFAKHQQAEKQAQHEAEDVEFNKRLSEEKRRDRRRAAVTTKPYVVREGQCGGRYFAGRSQVGEPCWVTSQRDGWRWKDRPYAHR